MRGFLTLNPTVAAVPFILSSVCGCSALREEPVSYPLYRTPVANFAKVQFLGVARTKGLEDGFTNELVRQIDRCGQYKQTNRLDTVFQLPEGDRNQVPKYLKGAIEAFPKARYVHGVLTVEIIRNSVEKQSSTETILTTGEKGEYAWFDSFGLMADPKSGQFGFEEIGPVVTFNSQKANVETRRIDAAVRYAMYNTKIDKLVFDVTSDASVTLVTYSKKPVLDAGGVRGLVFRRLLDKVKRMACPKIAEVQRTLYARNAETKADVLVQKGIDLAEDNRWEQAANSWQNAVLVDKANPFAHHNLGIYYERTGNVPKSVEEFELATRGTRFKEIPDRQFEASLDLLRPRATPAEVEPRIYAVTGAGWVSLTGTKRGMFKPGQTISVFRAVRHTNGNRVDGMVLTEVGRVRYVKDGEPFALARITEYMADMSIINGDILVSR